MQNDSKQICENKPNKTHTRNKHSGIMVIGLTGGIASGKSSVARILQDAHVPVIDADTLSREVCQPGSETLSAIVQRFGDTILNPDKSLNRARLAAIIFDNPTKRKTLEAIVHPAIEKQFRESLQTLLQDGHKFVVYMAPLIFEKGIHKKLDKTILLVSEKNIVLERIKKRDGLSIVEAEKRIDAQLDNRTKIKLADAVITNNGTLRELKAQLVATWEAITGRKLF